MTLQELLNADVRSIGALARQGLVWWIDELSSLLPVAWRESLSSRPKLLARIVPPEGWRFWKNGRPVDAAALSPRARGKVGLGLPADAVLVRDLRFPRLPLADVRRMVTLDIDRLSPLRSDLIHFDVAVVDRDAGVGTQSVQLGVLPRTTAARWLEAAGAEGLVPAALGVAVDDGSPAHRFDFLPAVRAAAGEPVGGRARRYWWAAAVALLLVNLAALVGRDMLDISRLRRTVASQHAAVSAALQLRHRVETEDAQRRELVSRGVRGDPLRMLNALTLAVPAAAWVQHLEWNGQALRIVGFKAADVDMPAAIRGSPAFTNPRALTTDAPVRLGYGQPFDITADAGKRPHS